MPKRFDGRSSGAAFRKLLADADLLETIWGCTAQHAQLAQAAGFKAFGISGSGASTTLLGLPDIGLMTMTEMIENLRRVCRAVEIPVIVDSDTGFGNAINVRRTVEEIIRAGAAGLFMEDQISPKRCGFVKGKDVISLEEAVGKYRAACDIRDEIDPDFVIIARSDARGAPGGSVEEVIRRGKAYLEAGADIFYAEALQSREEIRAVRAALPHGLFTTITMYLDPPLSRQEFIDLGICFTWTFIEQVGAIAIYDFLMDYKERGEPARIEFAKKTENHRFGSSRATGWKLYDLAGLPEFTKLEQRYLPKEQLERQEQTLGVYDPRRRS